MGWRGRVAWDFETEPEFEEELRWMRSFIDRELIPLEPILGELPPEEWRVVRSHLQGMVKAAGFGEHFSTHSWAAVDSANSSWR